MRKLATIRQIKQLIDIPGADRIEIGIVDGWQAIVKKGEFQVGSPCVFFEIDSFLPDSELYAFLGTPKTYKGKLGHRLKTMKMRKTLSQGLALPLSHYPGTLADPKIGTDVTELLGVIKYDVAEATPGPKNSPSAGSFPSFIPKTDQERIQNLTSYFDTMQDAIFEETLKLDGSSMTCYKIHRTPTLWERIKGMFGIPYLDYHFGVCSRNQELKRTDSNFWRAADKYKIETSLPVGYAIQGELLATNIQSNHEKISDVEYYVFDIYDIEEGRYLSPSERQYMMTGSLQNVPHVPIVSKSTKIFQDHDLKSLLQHVEGQSMNPGTISEGRVYKAVNNPQTTFKVISNKYLLKSEK